MQLFEQIDKYKTLLDKKDDLKEKTTANNKAIEECKNQLSQMMIDAECPKISRNGYVYSLQEKVMYSKKSEEDLAEGQIDFFDVLRNEGLGDIIVETVNTRTLQSTMAAYVEENGELSEELAECINTYETYDVAKRKETNKAAKNAKESQEE